MTLSQLQILFDTLKQPQSLIENAAYTTTTYSHYLFILRLIGQLLTQGNYAEQHLSFFPVEDADFLRTFGLGDCRGHYALAVYDEQIWGQSRRRAVAFNPTDPHLIAFYYVEQLNLTTGNYEAYLYRGHTAAYRTLNFGDLFVGLPVPESELMTNFSGLLIPDNVGYRQTLPFDRCGCSSAVVSFLRQVGQYWVQYFWAHGLFPSALDYTTCRSGIAFLQDHGFGQAWRDLCECDYYPYYEVGTSTFEIERAKLILYARSPVKRTYVLLVHKTAPHQARFGISQTNAFNYTQTTTDLGLEVDLVDSDTLSYPYVNGVTGFSPYTGIDPVDCVQNPINGMIPFLALQPCNSSPEPCSEQAPENAWTLWPGDNLRFYMPFPDLSLFPNNVDFENSTLRLCDLQTGEYFEAQSSDPLLLSPFEVFSYQSGELVTELFIYVNLMIESGWQGRCLRLCLMYGDPPTVFLCSRPLKVQPDCQARLIRIRCQDNALGYPYAYAQSNNPFYLANAYQQIRIRCTINQSQHSVDSVINKTSYGLVQKLYARLRETLVLETDYYDATALAFIAAAVQHDVFEIYDDNTGRWERYTAEDGLTITWPEGYPSFPLGKGKVLLYKTVDNRVNHFC